MSEENTNVETERDPLTDNPEEENVISLNDVLEYTDDLIEDAAAVLGAANDKTCSYAEVRQSNLDLDRLELFNIF